MIFAFIAKLLCHGQMNSHGIDGSLNMRMRVHAPGNRRWLAAWLEVDSPPIVHCLLNLGLANAFSMSRPDARCNHASS